MPMTIDATADAAQRVARLRALNLLEAPSPPLVEDLARLAAQVCEAPMALVTLLDGERQWFKAVVGMTDVPQSPRGVGLCGQAMKGDGFFEVEDALADARFTLNPLVNGAPQVRFYAGVPLILADGFRLGVLSVMDRQPRQLTHHQRMTMIEMGRVVSRVLLLRDPGTVSAAEAALRESEQRYRALSDSSPLGIYHADRDGRGTYTNERWRSIFGLTLEQSLGDGWSRSVHEDDRASVRAAWLAAAESGRDYDMEYRVRRPDGAIRYVRSRACALRDAQGVITGHVGVIEDITDRLEAQRRLRQEQQARQAVEQHAQELDALLTERSEMLDVLAHEVRQPLNNAQAALQAARAALEDPSRRMAMEPLDHAQHVLRNVIEGVNNTLAVSTALVGGSEIIQVDADLDMLISIAIADMSISDRQRIRVRRLTSVRTVWVDAGLLRLALRNLLGNALAHSPDGALVEIVLDDAEAPAVLNIDVIDQGPGIAEELVPRLFQRGARGSLRGGRPSHGLGLFIARRAMELQHGSVSLLRTGPEGTTMRLQITDG